MYPEADPETSRSALLAVHAAGLAPAPVRPVDPLRVKSGRRVFRVHCRGCGPATVVVKGGSRAKIGLEQLFYESVLSRLPVRTATLYGTFEDGDHTWLVLEDVGDQPAPDDGECRQALSVWCAAVHEAGSTLDDLPLLPDRGPTHFWNRLQRAGAVLRQRVDDAEAPRERGILTSAIEACDAVTARWDAVMRGCEGLPATVVQGDLATQNLRLRTVGDRLDIVVLDWEKAGWGVPAVDLARLSLSDYAVAARIGSPRYSSTDLELAAWAGKAFRVLVHDFCIKSPKAIERYANKLWGVLGEAT
jgi:Phosphotransferase enzyme family